MEDTNDAEEPGIVDEWLETLGELERSETADVDPTDTAARSNGGA